MSEYLSNSLLGVTNLLECKSLLSVISFKSLNSFSICLLLKSSLN